MRFRRLLRFFLLAVAALAGIVLAMALLPMRSIPPSPAPARHLSYEEAMQEIHRQIEETPSTIRPDSRDLVLEHGRRTQRVYVLLHGLSNTPAQFAPLGRLLHERGANVLIPRMPYHGETDRLTTSWGKLKAEDFVHTAERFIELAHALGDEVIVVGLSVNGTVASWLGQIRSDLSRVAVLSPFFAPCGLPPWLISPLSRILLRVPNLFFWWNPALKEANPGPPQAYPRFPTHIVADTMLLGQTVLYQASRHAPQTPDLLVITTAADKAIDPRPVERLVTAWRAHRPEAVHTYEFPLKDAVPHDFIDPGQPDQKVDLVYPKLLDLLEAPLVRSSDTTASEAR